MSEAIVSVHGAGVNTPGPFWVNDLREGEERTVEVPVEVAAPWLPGSLRRVTVEVPGDRREADITLAEPGWTMWMVSHFHYDPVWWSTQGQFAEARLVMPDEDGRLPDARTALELVQLHLEKARRDPDYKFVLAEIDYLKPYLDTNPGDRADLREFMTQGRVEIVGGNYNEPNTNLTTAESTIRNAVYGIGYQRDVAGGNPRAAWMLDVFGHDPGYPGLMAAAGLTDCAFARGPFHQWGPAGASCGGIGRMQFASEFEWLSPDGSGLLTHYMAHHYGAGWGLHTPPDLAGAEAAAFEQFRALSRVAATRNVLLPVGADHVIPARWVTDIHRSWNARYAWPRFVTAVPSEFFAAVRAEASDGASGGGAWITPQTRDMNPVCTGTDVSYIDTKQGQHAIEIALAEAERLAALAALAGAAYPQASLDKAWRLLAFGAHHDAITGVESDQVYLDLVGCWREAWDRADVARQEAIRHLGGAASGEGPDSRAVRIIVANGLARVRDGLARVKVTAPGGARWLELRDQAGVPVPALAQGAVWHPDGMLAEVTLTFRAASIPSLGWRAYVAVPVDASETTAEWAAAGRSPAGSADGRTAAIENEAYQVTADPERGGTIRITDRRTGHEVLRQPGNEMVLQEEYQVHPKHGEGPWNLSPKGAGLASGGVSAAAVAQRCPLGSRIVASYRLDSMAVTQETTLWDGVPRVEFRTHVDGYDGQDKLLRVRFPASVPGGLPVYQAATSVIGRSFGAVDVDSAEQWWTLDNPALGWFGLGSVARVRIGGERLAAIGVAEVVCPDDSRALREPVRELLIALAQAGVTATCSAAGGPRYGAVDTDSNLPDVRIVLGAPDSNAFSSAVLGAAGPQYAKSLASQLSAGGTAQVWVPAARSRQEAFAPGADVRGELDLPSLIVAGTGPQQLAAAVAALIEDLADAVIDVPDAGPDDGAVLNAGDAQDLLADRSVAVLNRGTPGSVVTPDGTLHLSLMRSCTGWPAGIWIDGEQRKVPDGSSFALQHWSHTFEYALASGTGDWRTAGFNMAAEDYAHDLIALSVPDGLEPPALPADTGLLSVEPAGVTLGAFKPRGNHLAAAKPWRQGGAAEFTVRLRETEGRPVTARIRLASGIARAWRTDLLEEADGDPVTVDDGAAVVDLGPFATVTLVLQPAAVSPAAQGGVMPAEAVPELVQPVYARYWLHGKGPAPAGNLPTAVHLSPTREAVGDPDADSAALRLTVAAGPAGASGQVSLLVPPELEVTPAGPLRYDLAGGNHATWDLTVRAAGAEPGRYFVAARIAGASGELIEDDAMIAVGEKRWPARDLPPEETLERMFADSQAAASEIELNTLTPALDLASGSTGQITVLVTSHLASQLRGEAQLISPFGTWDLLRGHAEPVVLAPSASTELRFQVTIPGTARPGSTWWALVKLMYFGRVCYSDSVPVRVTSYTAA